MNISNKPITDGGSGLKDHVAIFTDKMVKIRRTYPTLIIAGACIIAIIVALLAVFFTGWMLVLKSTHFVFGLLFIIVPPIPIYYMIKSFDFESDIAFEVNKAEQTYQIKSILKNNKVIFSGHFSDITAIQLLQYVTNAHNGTKVIYYPTSEVNLCLNNSKRINVIANGGCSESITKDAKSLASFLNVKLIHKRV